MSRHLQRGTHTDVATAVAIAIAVLFPETLPATDAVADAEAIVAWLAVLKFPLCNSSMRL